MGKSSPRFKIYESESVYGDESKFGQNSNRFEKMMSLIKAIKSSPKRVLDLGCGTGFLANEIKKVFPLAEVYGVDISSRALKEGQKKYRDIFFKHADVEQKFPFPEDYFDLIISGEQIEHLVDTDTYLLEINRVAKVGGLVILTTPNLASWFNRVLLLFGKQPFKTEASLHLTLPIFSLFGRTFPENLSSPAMGHLRVMTLDMLIKLLKVYGFKTTHKIGRTMLTKPLLRQLDELFSMNPSLACGLIIQARKGSSR